MQSSAGYDRQAAILEPDLDFCCRCKRPFNFGIDDEERAVLDLDLIFHVIP
ncbi:hypothetical protein D3C87_2095900 [compost metagenome]